MGGLTRAVFQVGLAAATDLQMQSGTDHDAQERPSRHVIRADQHTRPTLPAPRRAHPASPPPATAPSGPAWGPGCEPDPDVLATQSRACQRGPRAADRTAPRRRPGGRPRADEVAQPARIAVSPTSP